MVPAETLELISTIAHELEPKLVAYRRDLHKYAESGWTEFRTASLIARRLDDLGLRVMAGPQVVEDPERMGLPPKEALDEHWKRASLQGGDSEYLSILKGGYTGVVGILSHGQGPTIGMRFDIDANDLQESDHPEHRPAAQGFASVNPGVMHGCGHDGHAAIGLGIAELMTELKSHIKGTVKLVFQPAEEGVRGAKSMVAAGVVDDVDYMLGQHLYSGWRTAEYVAGKGNYLATTKFDALLSGEPAHAGGTPHGGKNALLAAATAVLNLYAIPRHREGPTRINVGRLMAGVGRNVICPNAHLVIETRGANTELNDYMYARAMRVLQAAADMYDCQLSVVAMGAAQSAESDPELAQRVDGMAQRLGGFTTHIPEGGGGSEDFTYMMRRVQEHGGLAVNVGIGADLGGFGHHTSEFDFDEHAMVKSMELLSAVAMSLMREPVRRG